MPDTIGTPRTCSTCSFYRAMQPDSEIDGYCHRYAPRKQEYEGTDILYSSWPATLKTDWCGEWSYRMTTT